MISLLEIAQSINEVDDEKVIKYKKKDGESGEMKAGSAKSMPKDHPAKLAWDKMQGDGGDDSEKDSGGKLGGGDFDRDGGDEPDMDSDDGDGGAPQVPKDGQAALGVVDKINDFEREGEAGLYDLQDEYDLSDDDVYELKNIGFDFSNAGEPLEDNQIAKMQDKINNLSPNAKKALESEFMDKPKVDEPKGDAEEKSTESENEKIIGSLEDMDLDGLNVDSLDSAIDSGQYASITGKDDDPDNEMSVNAFQDGDSVGYAINVGIGHDTIYFDSKEEALESAQKLFKDDKIRKAMDGEGEETLADLGNHAKSIVKGKDERIKVINGKKYKAIKESKKHPLKEIYDRTYRSLK